MSANSTINNQWPDSDQQDPTSNHYALSGKIMLASMITLFIVVVFLTLLHLYARRYLLGINRHRQSLSPRNRPPRIVYYIDNNRPPSPPTGGLDPAVLKSLPLFIYSSETETGMDESTPECAVCLSEFEDGEKGRVLVHCKHRFHIQCIDMWFFSNSTCPLCRASVEPVGPLDVESLGTGQVAVLVEPEECVTGPGSSAMVSSPVRHVAAECMGTTSSDRRKRVDVRIDVPDRNESVAESEFMSPGSRLLSLRRIISMSRKSPAVSPSSGGGPSCVVVVTESDHALAREGSDEEQRRL